MRENGATALSTVPLPPGADTTTTWEEWDHTCRVVWTRETDVAGIKVTGSAIQFPDGSIDAGTEEPPLVTVGELQFTTHQARELAAAIVATAELIGVWVTR
ncbi:hypothetical protein B4U45_28360 [Mycobacterium persicum]|uniref:Uncharacterized protein n=1 Tax=Mycobacterium persicum TaxID=1487726 RepID=A0A8E2INI7_9MYCO|nr:hypothetical protein [Mycobacterium persicum]KZS86118.1 hypothetical protein A4G31_27700 [Mycobacterium persicum]ORB40479.1 hypothetical protein BST40_21985 [Mycobacterium persicum]ORB82465.1 hypothetical protein B1T44_29140 [Mycobacterium persicum]ORB98851.1 hypothetical protein B4U45_28360 [Mycobacterium persicum]ORC02967.1 hypothetical protein B1T48_18635 [Mycobacterium persicum]